MPGHDHHLNFVYQPGDLNTEGAVYNWFCPVEEGDSEDITIIFRRQVFLFSLHSFLTHSLVANYFLSLTRLFTDFEARTSTIETKKSFLETSFFQDLFWPEQCNWNKILRYRRKVHL